MADNVLDFVAATAHHSRIARLHIRMPGIGYQKGNCTSCKILLQDPVQLTCGHSFCRSCASDKLHNTQCPECKKEFSVICPFSGAGCSWKGKLEEHENHRQTCPRKTDLIPPEKLFSSTYGDEQKDLTQLGIEVFFLHYFKYSGNFHT